MGRNSIAIFAFLFCFPIPAPGQNQNTVAVLTNADQPVGIGEIANEIAGFYYSTLTKSVPVRPKVSG